jgi:chloramphenicol-sensitive protein RarD
MSPPAAAAPGGETRQALAAGIVCYVLWGLMPAFYIGLYALGATPWEVVGQRALWAAPWALGLVLLSRQGAEALAVLRRPRVLALLALSAVIIGASWSLYVWAVAERRNLEASLGYYVNPLMNMGIGALVFRERVSLLGWIAIGLATVGVALQTVALGHLPVVAVALASSFCIYGVIRRQVAASAQVGLLIECLILMLPGLLVLLWVRAHGGGLETRGLFGALVMMLNGPATVAPLALFAWTARRLPFSVMGFLQFIGPTLGFATGILTGEPLSRLGAISFLFIWAGAATFALGAWRAQRRLCPALT